MFRLRPMAGLGGQAFDEELGTEEIPVELRDTARAALYGYAGLLGHAIANLDSALMFVGSTADVVLYDNADENHQDAYKHIQLAKKQRDEIQVAEMVAGVPEVVASRQGAISTLNNAIGAMEKWFLRTLPGPWPTYTDVKAFLEGLRVVQISLNWRAQQERYDVPAVLTPVEQAKVEVSTKAWSEKVEQDEKVGLADECDWRRMATKEIAPIEYVRKCQPELVEGLDYGKYALYGVAGLLAIWLAGIVTKPWR